MSKKISDLITPDMAKKIALISYTREQENLKISSLCYDSREVKKGAMFFALPGLHTDGHQYIAQAIERGAQAIVYENEEVPIQEGIAYIRVRDTRFAMSPLAAAFYDWPSRDLAVIGVTGTEGKSTTVYLIWQLLELCGKKAGFFSTVSYCIDGKERLNPEHQTTPEAPTVQHYLHQMRSKGLEYAVVEASSHGLSPRTNRLGDVDFDIAVVTNLTHEHLEFHGSWEQYRLDKARLFKSLDKVDHQKNNFPLRLPSFSVANADDPSIEFFADANTRRTYTWSLQGKDADLSVKSLSSSAKGSSYEVFDRNLGTSYQISDLLPGAFNVNNVLAALLSVSMLLERPISELVKLVLQLRPVRGRMSTLTKGQPFEVIIDYAHTPSSFEAVLPPLAQRIREKGGRLIVVFGSAGERDRLKRSLQGKVAAEHANTIVLTDEDPRGEDPMLILQEIASGCVNLLSKNEVHLIPDRRKAIRQAFAMAKPNDAVILLGKGHENSIIYADKTLAWDEIKEASEALKELGYGV